MEPFDIFWTFNITNALSMESPNINSCSVKIFNKQIMCIISTVYIFKRNYNIKFLIVLPAKWSRCEQSF